MGLTIFLIVLLLVVIYLLVMPIVLLIDTTTDQYFIQFRGLAKASLEAHEEEILRVKLKVFFLKFYFYPLKKINFKWRFKRAKKEGEKPNKRINFKTGFRLLKSFRIKRLIVDIDTGDYITNAKLYPVAAFLKHYSGNINVNFEGRNKLVICIQNRPINIIKSFINLKN